MKDRPSTHPQVSQQSHPEAYRNGCFPGVGKHDELSVLPT